LTKLGVHRIRGAKVLKTLKRRIEKLEDEVAPQRFQEIKIINHIPGLFMDEYGTEFTIRSPIKRKRR
jgi:hypothetical protein